MIVGCIGDVHGRACHALAVLMRWQAMRGRRFDLLVQVGDLGVLPDPTTGERPYDRFSQWDASVYDLCEIAMATGDDAELLAEVAEEIATPIYVVEGNHDEFSGIRGVGEPDQPASAPIDPHGLFHRVPDGCTLDAEGAVIRFWGGDLELLAGEPSGQLDVLVSHEGGFAGAANDDLPECPAGLMEFLKLSNPRFHIFGHMHHPVGPIRIQETQAVQLASVVSNPRDPTLQVINEGCIGALDTRSGDFEFIGGAWLGDYGRQGGLRLLAEHLNRGPA